MGIRAAAGRLARRRDTAPPARAAFAAASGDWEFLTAGVFVPTRGGWRELKLGLFQRRPRGAPACAAAWATRGLPAPQASAAFARLEDCDRFAGRWRGWAPRPRSRLRRAPLAGIVPANAAGGGIPAAEDDAAAGRPGRAGAADIERDRACRWNGWTLRDGRTI